MVILHSLRAFITISIKGAYSLNFKKKIQESYKNPSRQLSFLKFLFPWEVHCEALFTSHSIVYSQNVLIFSYFIFSFLLLIKVKVKKKIFNDIGENKEKLLWGIFLIGK